MQLINSEQLAQLLGVKVQTIHNKVSTRPEHLPPIVRLEGFKGPRWRHEDVEAWLREHVHA